MKGMKYIMYDRQGIETPILFPPTVEHDVMANKTGSSWRLLSAGFVTIGPAGLIVASGHSHSLNLKSREEDGDIIARWLTWEL